METITGETRGTVLSLSECVSAHDDCACHLTNVPQSPDDDNGFGARGDRYCGGRRLVGTMDCIQRPVSNPDAGDVYLGGYVLAFLDQFDAPDEILRLDA